MTGEEWFLNRPSLREARKEAQASSCSEINLRRGKYGSVLR
jgi:hypothetical protein